MVCLEGLVLALIWSVATTSQDWSDIEFGELCRSLNVYSGVKNYPELLCLSVRSSGSTYLQAISVSPEYFDYQVWLICRCVYFLDLLHALSSGRLLGMNASWDHPERSLSQTPHQAWLWAQCLLFRFACLLSIPSMSPSVESVRLCLKESALTKLTKACPPKVDQQSCAGLSMSSWLQAWYRKGSEHYSRDSEVYCSPPSRSYRSHGIRCIIFSFSVISMTLFDLSTKLVDSKSYRIVVIMYCALVEYSAKWSHCVHKQCVIYPAADHCGLSPGICSHSQSGPTILSPQEIDSRLGRSL